jgi:dolichyl-phosphate beta-glucosyltransferase
MRYLILVVVLIIHVLHNYYLAFQPSPILFGIGVATLILLTCYTFYPAYANVEGGLECTVTTILAGDTNNNNSNTQQQQHSDNTLSLVIPAYNEAQRLPIMLNVTLDYLYTHRKDLTKMFHDAVGRHEPSSLSSDNSVLLHYEFIIVNDGSTDDTEGIIKQYVIEKMTNNNANNNNNHGDTVKIVSMHTNCGKGGAVKVGTLQSIGQLCLMVDADGATDIADGLPRVLNSMKELVAMENSTTPPRRTTTTILPPAAVFGSRAHLEEESSAKRSKIRTILMYSFHFFVKILCSSRIKDTQCGFKLFTHSAVVVLFTNLHLRRW